MAHLVMENEKLRRKVKKAQQRRDHYARLYYRALAQFDETKWELTSARNKIQELKALGVCVCVCVCVCYLGSWNEWSDTAYTQSPNT